MGQGIESQAAEGAGGGVAQIIGHVTVGSFMNADGDYYAAKNDYKAEGTSKK